MNDDDKTVDEATIEAIVSKHGYIHKDTHIVRAFPCEACEGTGYNKAQLVICPHCDNEITIPFKKAKDIIYCRCEEMFEIERGDLAPCPNPYCKDGEVVKGLWMVEDCRDKCQHWDCCDECCAGILKDKATPVTHASIPADLSVLEWRVM